MVIYGAVFIAILAILVLYVRFREQAAWWEYLLPLAGAIIPALIIKLAFSFGLASDIEWWTGRIERVEFYEKWNEKVVYYDTETYTDFNGDLKTRSVRKTRIDTHYPYWTLLDSNGIEKRIDQSDYERITRRWGNTKFQDMRRSYHTIDGDMFFAEFPGGEDKTFLLTTTHRYTNKVAATDNVLDFEKINPDEWDVFDYPDSGWSIDDDHYMSQTRVSGAEARRLALFNTRWGKAKQIRVWFLVFKGDTLDTGYAQEAYWKGGNKNELVVCYGVNNDNQVQWGHIFSWTEREDFKVELRNLINRQKGEVLTFTPALDWMDDNIGRWERKEFADFNYISVPSPWWAVLINYVIVLACSTGVVYYSVMNEFTEDNPDGKQRYQPWSSRRF